MAAILAFSGCSLGEVKDKGASCPPKNAEHETRLGIIGGVECSETDCVVDGADYTENIQFGYCPMEFSQCGYDSAKDVYYCAKIACNDDEHIYDDKCESDSVSSCGSHDNDCSQLSGWKSGKCDKRQCVAEECVNGYEVLNGKCEAKSTNCEEGEHYYSEAGECEKNTTENCGGHGNNCTELSGWKDGACSTQGICLAIACEPGYELKDGKCVALTGCSEGEHFYNGSCEPDSVIHCGSHGLDCTRIAGWVGGDCSEGKCIASECDKGYELKDDKCEARLSCPDHQHIFSGECEDDSVENCGNHGNACTAIAGWLEGVCESEVCRASACSSGYELDAGKCVALLKCPEGQHLHEGACEEDSLENCGNHDYACANVPGWVSGSCTEGKCVPDACSPGYELKIDQCEALTDCPDGQHLHGGVCEADSIEHCGKHGNNCSASTGWGSGKCVNSVCVPDKCAGNYCLSSDSQCVDGEGNRNACGVSGGACVACSKDKICVNGECQVNTCGNDEHIYNGSCEPDSLANCGGHEKNCDIENAVESACISGGCLPIKCKDGFHTHGVSCEEDSTNHCGVHDKKCALENASSHVCESGTCKATGCNGAYHVYNGACEKDDTNHCGNHDYKCSIANASSHVCESKKCKAKACEGAYHVHNGECEPDDKDNCDGHGKKCSTTANIPNATDYICESKKCKATACSGANHAYNGACEPDDVNHCGSYDYKCNIANASVQVCESKKCKATACKDGYHVHNGACELDTVTDCGSHGNNCADIEYALEYACESGKCKILACDPGNHVFGSICEPDTVNDCGEHGNSCIDTIEFASEYECVSKTCKPKSCLGDTHVYQNICEEDSILNCGKHGNKCLVGGVSKANCESKTCKVTDCMEGYYLLDNVCNSYCSKKMYYCLKNQSCCTMPLCKGNCQMMY